MSLFDYIEKLFEQTKNINDRLSKVEIELARLTSKIEKTSEVKE